MRDLYWPEAVIGGAAPAEVAHMAAGQALFEVRGSAENGMG